MIDIGEESIQSFGPTEGFEIFLFFDGRHYNIGVKGERRIFPQGTMAAEFLEIASTLKAAGEYVEYFWHEGESIGMANDILSALQDAFVYLKRNLPGSWRPITAWSAAIWSAKSSAISADTAANAIRATKPSPAPSAVPAPTALTVPATSIPGV